MKRFLRSPLGATSYEGVTITWIRGRTPTLTIKRDGDEQDSIDLSPFSEEKLHALFVSKGPARAIDNDMVAKNEKFLKKNGNRPNLRRGARLGAAAAGSAEESMRQPAPTTRGSTPFARADCAGGL